MNQGYPLRLIIPVKYGVKHLKRIGTIFFSNSRPQTIGMNADMIIIRGFKTYNSITVKSFPSTTSADAVSSTSSSPHILTRIPQYFFSLCKQWIHQWSRLQGKVKDLLWK